MMKIQQWNFAFVTRSISFKYFVNYFLSFDVQ